MTDLPCPSPVSFTHTPVLLTEAVSAVLPKAGGVYIDATFGAGGYTKQILKTKGTTVIGIDRDENAIAAAASVAKEYKDRLYLVNDCFSNMKQIADDLGFSSVNGIVLDIGVSSMQIDDAKRGFSFQKSGTLDMRMGGVGITAADIVNTFSEKELADIIYTFGEERKSRQIAAAIVQRRKTQAFSDTLDLANIICGTVKRGKDGIHPATRTFQALRIYVNDELGELSKGLSAATDLLEDGGRLAVVSFHSLEDGIVKKFMNEKSGKNICVSRYAPLPDNVQATDFTVITKKPVTASPAEIKSNPRSRSAKLRILEKLTNKAAASASSLPDYYDKGDNQ